MKLFSELPHAIQGLTKSGIPFTILPGVTEMDDDAWAELSKDPRIIARMDNRRLRPEYNPLRRDLMTLQDPVSRHYIRELCAKSQQIADGQLFDKNKLNMQALLGQGVGGAQVMDAEARIRALEVEIAKLRGQV